MGIPATSMPAGRTPGFHYDSAGPQVGTGAGSLAMNAPTPAPQFPAAQPGAPYFGNSDGDVADLGATRRQGLVSRASSEELGLLTVGADSLKSLLGKGLDPLTGWIGQPVRLSEPTADGSLSGMLALSTLDKGNLAHKARTLANAASMTTRLNVHNASVVKALKKGIQQFQTDLRIQAWIVPTPALGSGDIEKLARQAIEGSPTDEQDNRLRLQMLTDLALVVETLDKLAPEVEKAETTDTH